MLRQASGQLLQLLRPASSCAAAASQTRSINFFDAPNGPAVKLQDIQDEWYNRQRPKLSLLDKTPWTQGDTWIAPNAVVAGDVDIYDQARAQLRGLGHAGILMLGPADPDTPRPRQVAIFYGAVLRGDLNKIRIGGNSVVLDRAVIHTAR